MFRTHNMHWLYDAYRNMAFQVEQLEDCPDADIARIARDRAIEIASYAHAFAKDLDYYADEIKLDDKNMEGY